MSINVITVTRIIGLAPLREGCGEDGDGISTFLGI